MRTYYDCIPCFLRQTLDAARMAGADETLQERIIRHMLVEISQVDITQPPPVMGQSIHRIIRDFVGHRDPYKAVKDRFNQFALRVYPTMQQRIAASSTPLETAARIAIAGNIIDFGVTGDVDMEAVSRTVEQALTESLYGDMTLFARAVADAGKILYLADNAGEIIFDRLLIEALPYERIILAVRGAPVINDATVEDARAAGLDNIVPIIHSGVDLPGTVLEESSEALVKAFRESDMIIAKGQGNYETLSDTTQHNNIFFLFKTKCPVAARDVGCNEGRFVLTRLSHHD